MIEGMILFTIASILFAIALVLVAFLVKMHEENQDRLARKIAKELAKREKSSQGDEGNG